MPDDTDKRRSLVCPHCGKPTAAKIMGQATWHGFDADGVQVDPPTEWAFLQCQVCWHPIVQTRMDYGYQQDFNLDEPTVIYPSPRRLSGQIPLTLRGEWEEARTCFDARAYTACVLMVRRLLEATCMEQGVKKGNLKSKLGALQTQGLVDGVLQEWAEALRIVGNKGAHDIGSNVERIDAEDALAFAEALLDHIYVLRKRFAEFQQRIPPPVPMSGGAGV